MMDKELPAKIWIPVLAACALLPIIIFNGPVQRFDDGGDVGGGGDASGSDFAFPTQAPASDQMTMTVQPLQQPNEQPVTVPIDTQDLSTLLQQPYNDLVSGGPEPTFGKFAPPDMTGVSELFTPTGEPPKSRWDNIKDAAERWLRTQQWNQQNPPRIKSILDSIFRPTLEQPPISNEYEGDFDYAGDPNYQAAKNRLQAEADIGGKGIFPPLLSTPELEQEKINEQVYSRPSPLRVHHPLEYDAQGHYIPRPGDVTTPTDWTGYNTSTGIATGRGVGGVGGVGGPGGNNTGGDARRTLPIIVFFGMLGLSIYIITQAKKTEAWKAVAYLFAVVIVGMTIMSATAPPPTPSSPAEVPLSKNEVRPNRDLTGGSVRTGDPDAACGHATENRGPMTGARRDEVLRRYGLPPGAHPDYEIDHLIPLCLGGSDDLSNLWPQPRRSIEATWNAEAKDKLEALMCKMVCDRQIDIATAQEAFATDWITAYHTYYDEGKKEWRR